MGCLGRLCRLDLVLSSRLGILAYAEAVALVGVAIASILRNDTAYNVLALATGALLGPAVAIWLAQTSRDTSQRRRAQPLKAGLGRQRRMPVSYARPSGPHEWSDFAQAPDRCVGSPETVVT